MIAKNESKQQNDQSGEHRANRAFGQCCESDECVEANEKYSFLTFVPCIPRQHSNAKHRSEWHVGRGSARESNETGSGRGHQRAVCLKAGPEASQETIHGKHGEGCVDA